MQYLEYAYTKNIHYLSLFKCNWAYYIFLPVHNTFILENILIQTG